MFRSAATVFLISPGPPARGDLAELRRKAMAQRNSRSYADLAGGSRSECGWPRGVLVRCSLLGGHEEFTAGLDRAVDDVHPTVPYRSRGRGVGERRARQGCHQSVGD